MSILDSEFTTPIEDRAPEAVFKSVFDFKLGLHNRINGDQYVCVNIFKKYEHTVLHEYIPWSTIREEIALIPVYRQGESRVCSIDLDDSMVRSWRMITDDELYNEFKYDYYTQWNCERGMQRMEFQVVRVKILPNAEVDNDYGYHASPLLIDLCVLNRTRNAASVLIKLADTDICLY